MGGDILVSACIITYNQEKYIAQAIESVINQKCDFKFELIIGEDCSKDSTRAIVAEYAAKYPDIIVPIFQDKNQGATLNFNTCLMRSRGKYFSALEGDDYWTDPYKLQRQFDFMEANPEFSLCFGECDVIDEMGGKGPDIFPAVTKDEFTFEDIVMMEKGFVPTATTFSKNLLPRPLPKFFIDALSGDIASYLLLADKGKFRYLPGKVAVYRDHSGGITKNPEQIKLGYGRLFKLYLDANEYFGYKYDKIFKKRFSEMSKINLIYGSRDIKGFKKLKYVSQNAPDYFKYSDTLSVKEVVYYFTVLFMPFLVKRRSEP